MNIGDANGYGLACGNSYCVGGATRFDGDGRGCGDLNSKFGNGYGDGTGYGNGDGYGDPYPGQRGYEDEE